MRRTAQIKFRPASDAELKAIGNDLPEGYVAGWASTPDVDYYGHIVATGAFDESISAKGLTGPKSIKFLIGHDHMKPAGLIRVLETRGAGLWMEAELNLKISYVRDIYEAAKQNDGFSFSVGFYIEDDQDFRRADGTEYKKITKAELEEISLVVFPANQNAVNTFIKDTSQDSAVFETISGLEKALVASGSVRSRNEAQSLVRLFKRNLHLLRPSDNAPAAKSEPLPAPVADHKLDGILKLLKQFSAPS
jgi:HK97 family phage prohead protease